MHPDIRLGKYIFLIILMILIVGTGLFLSIAMEKVSEKNKEDKFYSAGSYQQAKKAGNVDSGFEFAGYIVETNTGKAFIYELPGNPAIRKNLVLTRSSICDLGNGESVCSADSLIVGSRVQVTGTLEGEEITVKKITLSQ